MNDLLDNINEFKLNINNKFNKDKENIIIRNEMDKTKIFISLKNIGITGYELDELLSINNGADHYITKPFNIQILLAKIGALLRRTNMQGETNDKIDVKDFILNTSNNTIEKDRKVIELTKNEYKILKYLVQNRGKIVSREDIMECLWESESFIDDNTLTVNITRLRNKLEELELKELLETKRGQGYILKKGVN